MCSRSIRAHFTAGPKAATFSIDFSTESDEGAEEIVVESGLFSYDSPQGGRSVKVKDHEISEFLQVGEICFPVELASVSYACPSSLCPSNWPFSLLAPVLHPLILMQSTGLTQSLRPTVCSPQFHGNPQLAPSHTQTPDRLPCAILAVIVTFRY